MGLFSKHKQKKQAKAEKKERQLAAEREAREKAELAQRLREQEMHPVAFHEEEYRNALRLYDEAHADAQYQHDINRYYALITEIREMYSVFNTLDAFESDKVNKLMDICANAVNLEISLKEKREYYENRKFDMSEAAKILAMVFEKRGEYDNAASVCVVAIEAGFVSDGTAGGMRGRLARMIKKGDLPLTDEMKKILNL